MIKYLKLLNTKTKCIKLLILEHNKDIQFFNNNKKKGRTSSPLKNSQCMILFYFFIIRLVTTPFSVMIRVKYTPDA